MNCVLYLLFYALFSPSQRMSSHPFSWSVSKVDALRYKRISKIIGGRERWVFMEFEIDLMKKLTPDRPVTTNFMQLYDGLDYRKMTDKLDVIS